MGLILIWMRFRDRWDAGGRLLTALESKVGGESTVLAIPRGGVVIGYVIAEGLGAPLDLVMVRKIGVPGNPELAAGAVAEGGEVYVEEEVLELYGLDAEYVTARARSELETLRRRASELRGGLRPLPIEGKEVVLTDDGIATGSTVIAACRCVRSRSPRRLVVAVPVASAEAASRVSREADELVALYVSEDFLAVGEFYEDFSQVDDNTVRELLTRSRSIRA
ncbi:MAG: phosphoribosyltransferase family protein [Nitrososphaerota archaeon]|nr:phosphoribosyltransferase family protein [Nitrososphaerota archaeon]